MKTALFVVCVLLAPVSFAEQRAPGSPFEIRPRPDDALPYRIKREARDLPYDSYVQIPEIPR